MTSFAPAQLRFLVSIAVVGHVVTHRAGFALAITSLR